MVRIVAVVHVAPLVQEILLQVFDGGEIAEIAVAAREGELGLVVVAVVAVHLAPPVHIRIGVGVLAAVQGEEFRIIVFKGQAIQRTGLVHEESVRIGVRELGGAEHRLVAVLVLGGHLQLRVLAALGGDGDDAVTALDAVQRGSGRVLEDFDLFDFQPVQVVQRTGETVHQQQRAVAVQAESGLQAGLVGVIDAGAVLHQKAGKLTVQGVGNVHFGTLREEVAAAGKRTVRLQPEQVPQFDGIQRRNGFLGGSRRTCKQERKGYIE